MRAYQRNRFTTAAGIFEREKPPYHSGKVLQHEKNVTDKAADGIRRFH